MRLRQLQSRTHKTTPWDFGFKTEVLVLLLTHSLANDYSILPLILPKTARFFPVTTVVFYVFSSQGLLV
jgi:hypothetical protein